MPDAEACLRCLGVQLAICRKEGIHVAQETDAVSPQTGDVVGKIRVERPVPAPVPSWLDSGTGHALAAPVLDPERADLDARCPGGGQLAPDFGGAALDAEPGAIPGPRRQSALAPGYSGQGPNRRWRVGCETDGQLVRYSPARQHCGLGALEVE